ncbi:PREDICTED: uncharacterized protein LOC104586623 [Nelumbo nucifera]|uniref:Uncharacterized protein LOC104586623 n=1 Tax=Nelumbo nucifera TaxID=4432 RepID=A0A1U7YSZ5_NELNU|nr:PREDICTED: uncharacterized protein LOC104586623 [Nelumbo nucifera]
MKESRKRPEPDDAPSHQVAEKRSISPEMSDDEEDLLDGAAIEEEMVAEVMKSLEEVIRCPTGFNPPTSTYMTINGNKDICGASFSDSASTRMASVDIGGTGIPRVTEPAEELSGWSMSFSGMESGQWALDEENECRFAEVVEVCSDGGNGCDGGESDDEWLARILSCPPLGFEE